MMLIPLINSLKYHAATAKLQLPVPSERDMISCPPSLQLVSRHGDLLVQAQSRRSRLEESHSLQQFLRDTEEARNWIQEKMKTAQDEAYKDPTNLEAKLQQHQAFESELQANKGRIDVVVETGEELSMAEHYAADTIR